MEGGAGRLVRRALALGAAALLCGCFNTFDWREFRSADGRYAVTLPGKAVHEERTMTTPAGEVTMHMDSTSAGSAAFGVGYADYPAEYLARAGTATVLAAMRNGLLKNIGGAAAAETPFTLDGYSGIALHAESAADRGVSYTLDARLLLARNRFYQVVAIGKAGRDRIGQNELDLYFKSFRITK
jgi:hypothetical protein